jgi:putative tributyrin esterase
LALNYPEQYCAAASLSGALDLASRAVAVPPEDPINQDLINIFGQPAHIKNTKHDLLWAAKTLKTEGKPFPRLYQCCGDQDFLYQDNLAFRDFARKEELPLTWQEDQGYEHTWDYWDFRIQTVLEWMFM